MKLQSIIEDFIYLFDEYDVEPWENELREIGVDI